MKIINNLLKKNKQHELCLGVIFAVYLIFNVQTPAVVAKFINNIVGLVLIVLSVIYLLMNANPIIGILSVLVAYELLRRSEVNVAELVEVTAKQPSEKKKQQYYSKFNKIPVSLEEEHIRKIAPQIRTSRISGSGRIKNSLKKTSDKFKPVLGASELNPLPVGK